MKDQLHPMKVIIHGVSREYDKFFKIDRLDTEHERYEGGTYRFPWLVFERGDSVAVVLYKKDSHEIVLVRQFRAPTLKYREAGGKYTPLNDGQLDETIAGMPRKGETLEDCAIREVFEESRYKLRPQHLDLIAQFYSSPGGTSERIYLYYAEVTDADYVAEPNKGRHVAGVSEDAESILVRHIPVSTFFAELIDPRVAIDSKVLIASMLVRERLAYKIPNAETQPAPVGSRAYTLKARPNCLVVLRSGSMTSVKDVDAWVNSENTDMEMDRFIGTSVSALIRHAGAAKDSSGRVIDDTIADALRTKMRGRFTSNIGTIHDTTPGELQRTHNVKRLFHVAAVRGVVNKGMHALPADVEMVVHRALQAIERRNRQWATAKCASALLPMIGTGDAGISVEVAFPEIVKGIVSYFDANASPVLSAVHLSAYRQRDADFAMSFLDRHDAFVLKA